MTWLLEEFYIMNPIQRHNRKIKKKLIHKEHIKGGAKRIMASEEISALKKRNKCFYKDKSKDNLRSSQE